MTEFVATIIFVSIMLVGSIVWIIALCFALRIGKPSANREWGSNAESTLAESTLADSTFGLNTGETVCDASKAELMEHIPKVLRRQSLGVLNSVFKLDAKSDQELLLTRHGPLMCNLPTALYFSKVRFRLESTSLKQTRVRYTIDQVDSMRVIKRIAMLILFCVGLPVLLGFKPHSP